MFHIALANFLQEPEVEEIKEAAPSDQALQPAGKGPHFSFITMTTNSEPKFYSLSIY